jgi:hypothetical protein
MDQVSIKYTNIFQFKTLQNLPKFGCLVWKQTIWQPWTPPIYFRRIGTPGSANRLDRFNSKKQI